MPHGPPACYITEEVDDLLDVSHLKNTFIVSSFQDRLKLIETASLYGIQIENVIVYDYNDTELYDPVKKMGFEGTMPVVVANVLFDHAQKVIVSFHFYKYEVFINQSKFCIEITPLVKMRFRDKIIDGIF